MARATKTAPVLVSGLRVDWRAAPPTWVTINVALATCWLAAAAFAAGLPWGLLVFGGVAAAAAAAVMVTGKEGRISRITWRICGLAAATAWACWVAAAGPTLLALAVGAVLTIVAMLMAKLADHLTMRAREKAEVKKVEAAAAEQAAATTALSVKQLWNARDTMDPEDWQRAMADAWMRTVKRVASMDVKIAAVARWDSDAGYDMYVELPTGGATASSLSQHITGLASDVNLPRGCGVTVTDGDEGQRVVYMGVSHINALKETVEPPTDFSPSSIYNPIPIGRFADTTVATLSMQQQSVLVVGMKGSGKTNLLRVIIRELLRCPDTLIWCIDIGGGGGLVRDLLRPFYDGETAQPMIDFPILDVKTAEAALNGLLRVIPARKGIYDTTNLQVSRQVPQIMIITDELGNVPPALKSLLVQASDLGRASGHQQVNCALRGIEAYVPNDLVVQSAEGIVMGVGKEAEAQYIYDWDQRLDIKAIKNDPGRGFVNRKNNDGELVGIEQFKVPYLDEKELVNVAKKLENLRPELDEPSRAIMNQQNRVYDKRFELAAPLLWPGREYTPVSAKDLVVETGDAGVDEFRNIVAELDDKFGDASAIQAEIDRRLAEGPNLEAAADEVVEDETPVVSTEPQASATLISADEVSELEQMLDAPMADNRMTIEFIVRDAGIVGISPAEVQHRLKEDRKITVERRTVRRHLSAMVTDKIVFSPKEGLYIHNHYYRQDGDNE